jgi:hypothetical protein
MSIWLVPGDKVKFKEDLIIGGIKAFDRGYKTIVEECFYAPSYYSTLTKSYDGGKLEFVTVDCFLFKLEADLFEKYE